VGGMATEVRKVEPIRHESTEFHILTIRIDRGQLIPVGKLDEQFAVREVTSGVRRTL
jgi:hypothetical protein